uniref:Integrase core domain containing protein n=1 Tax=Solanum tuberosum TaxID=4113 RepID=M1DXK1_SOLTU
MEIQMATLLQHMKPWMQHSITESEARMEQMMDQRVKAVHKRLNAFEFAVLERPTETIDVTTFQRELAGLRADVATLLAPTKTERKSAPAVPEDEVVMTALFGDTMQPPDSSRVVGKRPTLTTLPTLMRLDD